MRTTCSGKLVHLQATNEEAIQYATFLTSSHFLPLSSKYSTQTLFTGTLEVRSFVMGKSQNFENQTN